MLVEIRQLVPGYQVYIDPDEALLISAAKLVTEVSLLTGFPDPVQWPGDTLFEHTRERHVRSMLRLVVCPQDNPGLPVAHSLLVRPKDSPWSEWDEARKSLARGELAESGATAVRPDYQRRGIAKAMHDLRWDYAMEKGWRVCAATWSGGASVYLYKNNDRWMLLGERVAPLTKRPALYWLSK